MKLLRIGGRMVGPGHPAFLIAEMSANHGGSLERALKIVRAAKRCGADAVKLQTYRADTITLNCDSEDFQIPPGSPWEEHRTLYSLYEKAHTPWEWHEVLFREGREIGIQVFSSPFDDTAVDLLEDLDAPAYKIASPEITDIPLLKRIASTGKPVLLSTGAADLGDVALAVSTLRGAGCRELALLKCTTAYPAPPEEINLRTIPNLAETFDCVAGLSDHSLGIGVPVGAVALGASIIEKHLMLEKSGDSIDEFFSLTPGEMAQLVTEVRNVEKALGTVAHEVPPSAKKSLLGRRSLYVARDVARGERFSEENIRSVRPSMGMHPMFYEFVLGRKARQDLVEGDRLSWDVIDTGE